MLAALRDGTFGIRLDAGVPSSLELSSDDEHVARLTDRAHHLTWWLFFFPDLHMHVEIDAGMEAALHAYARQLFDDAFRAKHAGAVVTPRTADETWSPLVDVERVALGEATGANAALRTVHRMSYEPGDELVMGHLLVPLAGGLFEARVAGRGSVASTGYRESAVFLEKGARGFLPQPVYDDAALDARFPGHPLTLVRSALRTLIGSLHVVQPAPTRAWDRVRFASLGCELTPPARFVLEPSTEATGRPTFRRVAFCGTDGIELFYVEPIERDVTLAFDLVPEVEARAQKIHEAAGWQNVMVAVEEVAVPSPDIDRAAIVVVEGDATEPVHNRRRSVMLWCVDTPRDDRCDLWLLAIAASNAVSASEHARTLVDVATSWRRAGSHAPSGASGASATSATSARPGLLARVLRRL